MVVHFDLSMNDLIPASIAAMWHHSNITASYLFHFRHTSAAPKRATMYNMGIKDTCIKRFQVFPWQRNTQKVFKRDKILEN